MLVDSSLIIEAEREHFDLESLETAAPEIWLCDAGLVEFLSCKEPMDDAKRRRFREFCEYLKSFPSLPLDRPACLRAAEIMSQARQRGHTVNLGDGLHAGVASLHGLVVATRDVNHFRAMGLDAWNPMASENPARRAGT